jgi:hypothetical protein
MDAKNVAEDIIADKQLFTGMLVKTKQDIWLTFIAFMHKNIDRITTEDEFLAVLREMCIIAIPVNTGNKIADSVINSVKSVAVGYILNLIDKYCLDKWFGYDWFDKLRATALKLLRYPALTVADLPVLVNDDEIVTMYANVEPPSDSLDRSA